jgi:PAS domain S-box-containing protein
MSRILSARPNSYGLAIAMVTAATLATQWLLPVIDAKTYVLFDAVAVVITWYGGMKAGLVAVMLSVLAIDVFLLSPQQIFDISAGRDSWHLVLSTLVSLLIVFLTSELHKTRQRIQQLSDRKVQHQEAQLHMALQAAQMGIWYWDIVSGKMTWSLEHEAIFGLAPNTFDGRYATFEAYVYEGDRDHLNQALQQAIRHRTDYQHEYRVVWRDGSIHWVEGRGQTCYNDAGQPIYMTGTVTNIDQRKQAKSDLQRYERIVSTTPDLIALIDRTYTYQMVNRAYLRRFQKRHEQVIGYSVAEIVGNQVFETEYKSRLDRALAGGRVQFYLWYDFPIAKHRYLNICYTPYVEPDQTISGVIVSIRDLTDLQQARAELQQSEENLRQVLQQMPVMLDAFDANGNIICWNQECERVTGYSADEVFGNPTIMELFYPDAAYRQQMMNVWMEQGNNYRNWEWNLVCKDGSTRTIAWSNLSAQFPVPGWASWGVGVDVTDSIQTTAALNRLNADLERQIAECRLELQQERQKCEQIEQLLRDNKV